MKLSEEDTELFYKLYLALLVYTNQQKGIIRSVTTVDEFMQLPSEEINKVREALYGQPGLIEAFVKENLFNFSQEELEIVRGWNIRQDLKERYQEAKARFGIITSLPWVEIKDSDEERLKSYLSSEAMRLKYGGIIDELIKKDPSLLTVYHQEMGKVHARTYGRCLSKIGLRNAWFAILEGEVVAGGCTRAEVERILDENIPVEKRDFAYVFHLKGK